MFSHEMAFNFIHNIYSQWFFFRCIFQRRSKSPSPTRLPTILLLFTLPFVQETCSLLNFPRLRSRWSHSLSGQNLLCCLNFRCYHNKHDFNAAIRCSWLRGAYRRCQKN